MEIYNLRDKIPNGKETQKKTIARESRISSEGLMVTDLKQGVKNPNRVNVFIDEKFAFSLDVAQVVDFKLKVGKAITEAELAEYKKASEFGKEYQRALEWVLVRPRSVRELRDYFRRKQTEYGDRILERLVSKGYVDDRKFAEYYVENRFVKKGISRRRMQMELAKKGIARDLIDEMISRRSDEEEIDKIIAKKRNKYDDDKLINYLCRQGFSYQLAQSRVRDCGKD